MKLLEITYEVECLPEDMPYVGNCMASGVHAVDRETEEWISDQLAHGNEWAWCCAKVTASVRIGDDVVSWSGYLGGCSYMSEKDFMAEGGYYTDMCNEVRDGLLKHLRAHVVRGKACEYALLQLEGKE